MLKQTKILAHHRPKLIICLPILSNTLPVGRNYLIAAKHKNFQNVLARCWACNPILKSYETYSVKHFSRKIVWAQWFLSFPLMHSFYLLVHVILSTLSIYHIQLHCIVTRYFLFSSWPQLQAATSIDSYLKLMIKYWPLAFFQQLSYDAKHLYLHE